MGLQVDSISCSIIGPFADYEFRTDRDLMIDSACSLEEDEGSLCIKIESDGSQRLALLKALLRDYRDTLSVVFIGDLACLESGVRCIQFIIGWRLGTWQLYNILVMFFLFS